MRTSRHALFALAIALAIRTGNAPAETSSADPVPVLDVGITAGRCLATSVELLGRAAPGSVCVSVGVTERGGRVVYFQPVGFVLESDGSQRATREAAGLTFNMSVSSSSKSSMVHAELVVLRGGTAISYFTSVTALPLPGSGSR